MNLLIPLILAAAAAVFGADDKKTLTFSREDFNRSKQIPNNWAYRGKLFTPAPKYSIVKTEGREVLHIDCQKASGVILTDISGLLQKYPYLSWKWRVLKYPEGADGRDPKKDDQVIAIYVGAGKISSNSLSYRWDTDTPKHSEGEVRYGAGMVKVKWFTLRNKTDGTGVWMREERNAAEDLKKICGGTLPSQEVGLTVSANSQYTGSKAAAQLEYIEFSSRPQIQKKK